MKSIYIAGPMTGYPEFNFPAFFSAQTDWERSGWKVFNPANKDEEVGVTTNSAYATGDAEALVKSGWSFKDAFKWDTDRVIDADAIYMLKGWEASVGARAEHSVAMAIKARYPTYEIYYE